VASFGRISNLWARLIPERRDCGSPMRRRFSVAGKRTRPAGDKTAVLDDATLDKILGSLGDKVPSDLDRSQLAHEVKRVWDFYQGCRREDSKSGRTQRWKVLKQYSTKLWRQFDGLSSADRLRLAKEFERFEIAVCSNLAGHGLDSRWHGPDIRGRQSSWREVLDGLSPKEWFISRGMAEIFERHFKKEATCNRDVASGQVCGPFVSFVCGITAELGEPLKGDTIVKAMTARNNMKKQMAAAIARRDQDIPNEETTRRGLRKVEAVIAGWAEDLALVNVKLDQITEEDGVTRLDLESRRNELLASMQALEDYWRAQYENFGINYAKTSIKSTASDRLRARKGRDC
jgi:hypothetical protein